MRRRYVLIKAFKGLLTVFFLSVAIFIALPAYAGDAVPAISQEEAAKFLQASERALDLQTEFPAAPTTQAARKQMPDRQIVEKSFNIPDNIAKFVLWISIIVIFIVIIVTLRDSLWSHSRSERLSHSEDKEEHAPAATVARMEKAQVEADDLARQECFAEAMHVLLLQSVNELRRKLRLSIAASLTSREILHSIGFSPGGREAFGDIISRVEISYFGRYQPGAEDYLACRRSFDALTGVLRQRSST